MAISEILNKMIEGIYATHQFTEADQYYVSENIDWAINEICTIIFDSNFCEDNRMLEYAIKDKVIKVLKGELRD